MLEKTLLIIKPDSVAKKCVGQIIDIIEKEGFTILSIVREHFSLERAKGFYAEHDGKEFFERLINFMTSGPCLALALEREEAVSHLRSIIGATDATKAVPGTIRHKFGSPGPQNAVHASDSLESSARERAYFFPTG